MLSESLDLKYTYSIISFIYTSRKCKLTYSEETDYKGAGGDFSGDEYVHYFDCIDGFMSI